ncbi:hypothetical protein Slin_3249 [Spirosoma linguale DSM 74]|uniref:Uncharacterized protein n=2 Tax=Spirosoma TaxID=107 RepID=D2QN71_SPILD|nr:hypothetical protein Slin_3249 [Spirosoma linguale DSM 74]
MWASSGFHFSVSADIANTIVCQILISMLMFITRFVCTIAVLLLSCQENVEQPEYYKFNRQLSPDKKYYIYEYARYGPMAFSSDISGTRIMSTAEKFSEAAGEDLSAQIGAWISKDTLLLYDDFESGWASDTLPIRIKYDKFDNIVLKRVSYKSIGGGRAPYTFDSLRVSAGKLQFFGVDSVKSKSLTFSLGSITLRQQADSINRIDVYEVKKWYNAANEPMVTLETYEFIPTRKISPKNLGTVGIFMELKKETN